MPRLWYPERFHVELICHKLAEEIFATEEYPLPAFSFLDGERGAGLLESALALPRQSFGGRYFYKTWDVKAAALLRSIIKNHSLIDGNKRIGLATTMVFLLMNGRLLFASSERMVAFALSIASPGDSPTQPEIARWIKKHAVPINRIRRFVNTIKKDLPDSAAELDGLADTVLEFSRWARRYRRVENDVRREARRLGINPAEILAAVAERVWLGTPVE